MKPQPYPLFASIQGNPAMGLLIVIGWDDETNQPIVVPLYNGKMAKPDTSTARVYHLDMAVAFGPIVLHDTRAAAEDHIRRTRPRKSFDEGVREVLDEAGQ